MLLTHDNEDAPISAATAATLADALAASCEHYHEGKVDHAGWTIKQRRLWDRVDVLGLHSEVIRLLHPGRGGRS